MLGSLIVNDYDNEQIVKQYVFQISETCTQPMGKLECQGLNSKGTWSIGQHERDEIGRQANPKESRVGHGSAEKKCSPGQIMPWNTR